ncbi:hypothetical protein H5P35_18035 [Mycobacterium haemophilum DSM 44634]|nr:hypothetical protein [Mycobacterium haemophilum]MCV7342433.1 hypothetical protein [Mycobacterium haemophilum DSM 44634]
MSGEIFALSSSLKRAAISSVVNPLAYNANTISSTRVNRRCCFLDGLLFKAAVAVEGTAISILPGVSVSTVFRGECRCRSSSSSRHPVGHIGEPDLMGLSPAEHLARSR